MTKDFLRYDEMVEAALRAVVREALGRVAQRGLFGGHHFYITFKTGFPGVEVPDYLRAKYPEEMTVVLEHQFWDLEIGEDRFSVTLKFQSRPERLGVPLAAITAFADPSVKFHLQFQTPAEPQPGKRETKPRAPKLVAATPAGGEAVKERKQVAKPAERAEKKPAEIVALDAFRKK
jgi:hypothetical protein